MLSSYLDISAQVTSTATSLAFILCKVLDPVSAEITISSLLVNKPVFITEFIVSNLKNTIGGFPKYSYLKIFCLLSCLCHLSDEIREP